MDFSLSEQQSVWRDKASCFADEELRPSWGDQELSHGALAAIYEKASAMGLFDVQSIIGGGDDSSSPLTAALVTEELSKGNCDFAAMFVNRYLSSRAARLSTILDFQNDVLGRVRRSLERAEIAFFWPGAAAHDTLVEYPAGESSEREESDTSADESLSYAHSNVEWFVGCGRMGPPNPLPGLHLVLAERTKLKSLEARQGAFSKDSLRLYRFKLSGAQDLKVLRRNDGDLYDRRIENLLADRAILSGAMALGIAAAAFDYSIAYSSERIAFGRPIIQHQAVGLKLADMYIDLETARLLLWNAALDRTGHACELSQAYAASDYSRRVALNVTSKALQTLGGHGYLRDHPIERWAREARFLRLLQ